MNRDMSYELDDAFSTRDNGEIIKLQARQPRVLRGGDMTTPIMKPNYQAIHDEGPIHAATSVYEGQQPVRATGLMGAEVDIPVVGRVNLVHVGIGIGVGALIMWALSGKKSAP